MKFDTTPALDLWNSRTPRERVLLCVMMALIAVLALWYGVVQPLRQGALAASEARAAAMARFSEATLAGQRIQTLQGRFGAQRTAAQMESLVTQSAAANGMMLDRQQANGAVLTVWADAADARTVFAWLDRLQARQGITVASLTVAPADGGGVQVQAGLTSAAASR